MQAKTDMNSHSKERNQSREEKKFTLCGNGLNTPSIYFCAPKS